MKKKIALGSDHGGYKLKQYIKEHLAARGFEVCDFGTNDESSCDYPLYGKAVGEAVASKKCDLGILVCGTGIGISLAANKINGIRAAVCSDTFSAKYTRMHNDANILALGERVVGFGLALELVDTFLDTEFEGGRHQKRIDMLMNIENER